MSPSATPIIVVPRKSKPSAPLAETKRVVIDYQELNEKIPKVQTIQVKSKGTLQGSQNNWSTLTKEAYAIYMSFKMVFYLKDAHIMI